MLTKIKIGAIIAIIVVVECSAAWFFIPSAAATNELAQERLEDQVPSIDEINTAEEQSQGEDRQEVDLGEFDITSSAAGVDAIQIIRFNLFGTIDEEDSSAFDKQFNQRKNKIRGDIILIMRAAEMKQLDDPALGLIKRTILGRINDSLGEPYLKEIIFSEFQSYNQ